MDKKCSKCQEIKNVELFNKRGKYFRELCKSCESKRHKEWREKTNHYEKNKEKFKEESRKRYNNNKERENKRCGEWKKNNREKINKWLSEPINRIKENFRKYKRRGAIGKVKYSDWVDLCNKYENKCLCCGSKKDKLTIDHVIPLILGGTNTIENIQPLCGSCNSKKGIKTTDYRL